MKHAQLRIGRLFPPTILNTKAPGPELDIGAESLHDQPLGPRDVESFLEIVQLRLGTHVERTRTYAARSNELMRGKHP